MLKFVYIMEFDDHALVKIGVSSDPCKRMIELSLKLGVIPNGSRFYISRMQKDPYAIERKCHKILKEFRLNGYGQNKIYKREIFKCDLLTAKSVLEAVLNGYENDPKTTKSYLAGRRVVPVGLVESLCNEYTG